jgi:hypothetical protein
MKCVVRPKGNSRKSYLTTRENKKAIVKLQSRRPLFTPPLRGSEATIVVAKTATKHSSKLQIVRVKKSALERKTQQNTMKKTQQQKKQKHYYSQKNTIWGKKAFESALLARRHWVARSALNRSNNTNCCTAQFNVEARNM